MVFQYRVGYLFYVNVLVFYVTVDINRIIELLKSGPPKHADIPMFGNPRLAENTSATRS